MTADPLAQAVAAWAHFISIFLAVACVAAEVALYRRAMSGDVVRALQRIDAGYGLAGLLIVATGLLRVFYFAKGADYYVHNGIFWVKMALVATVIILSVLPTMHFLRLPPIAPPETVSLKNDAYRRIRALLWAEVIVAAFIPLAATLMARGVG